MLRGRPQDTPNTAAAQRDFERAGNALKCAVVKRQDVVLVPGKLPGLMVRVNRVHSFEGAQPRRVLNFERCVGPKATRS